MPLMARLIKRYENRKLYDTEASSYVSQRDVARLVRRGETVQVVDNVTGEDLTAQILTQIILEEGKRGDVLLPTDVLHDVLRRSGEAVESGLEQLRHGAGELVQQSLGRLNRLLHSPASSGSGEVEALRTQLAHLEEQLARVLEEVERREEDAENEPKRRVND